VKYAKEVMSLLAAYPGREFRMREIINSIAGAYAEPKIRKQVHIGVWRVLQLLADSKQVIIRKGAGSGAGDKYAWHTESHNAEKALHEDLKSIS